MHANIYMYVLCCVLFEAFDLPHWFRVFFAYRSCCKNFCGFQALKAQTHREENVHDKIRATTLHVQCVVRDHGRRRPDNMCYLILIILSKKKACDYYRHLILIDLSKKRRNVIVIVIRLRRGGYDPPGCQRTGDQVVRSGIAKS